MKIIDRYKREVLWFVLGLYFAAVILAYSTSNNTNIIQTLNSLGGFISGGGACAAILTLIHVIYEKEREKKINDVSYANFILLTLDRQITFLRMLESSLKSSADLPDAVKPFIIPIHDFDTSLAKQIDLEKSIFLLQTTNPQILAKIDAVQRNFSNLASRWCVRNQLWLEYHQAVSRKYGVNGDVQREQVIALLGQTHVLSLEQATAEILGLLPNSIRDIPLVHRELSEVMIKNYPRHGILVSEA
ncbi:TPA: hypothetical protein I7722_21420 [Vibrio vulnificus]|nr:hypothetical protein [Vibrio vulnificus]HAS8160727.1 hypothetical protein [Vibrio vulnificus]HAS8552080.1 hypothetical protein [Vibrio vulnificus]